MGSQCTGSDPKIWLMVPQCATIGSSNAEPMMSSSKYPDMYENRWVTAAVFKVFCMGCRAPGMCSATTGKSYVLIDILHLHKKTLILTAIPISLPLCFVLFCFFADKARSADHPMSLSHSLMKDSNTEKEKSRVFSSVPFWIKTWLESGTFSTETSEDFSFPLSQTYNTAFLKGLNFFMEPSPKIKVSMTNRYPFRIKRQQAHLREKNRLNIVVLLVHFQQSQGVFGLSCTAFNPNMDAKLGTQISIE